MKTITMFSFACALLLCNLASADLTTGLVAYYPFNGNANDASGNGNNGTVYGATLTADRFGNANSAFNFDGINDNIIIPNSSSQQILTNKITTSAWILPSGNANDNQWRIVNKQENNSISWGLEIFGPNYVGSVANSVSFHDSNGMTWVNCVANGRNISPNSWYHVLASDDNGIIKIYINGTLEQTCINGVGILPNINAPIVIAAYDQISRWFNGIIDEVRIYNRSLTATEVTELYSLENTQAPTATTTAATNITPTSATLNAQINSNGDDAIVGFELGTSTNYGTPIAATPDLVSGTTTVPVSGTATGLTCNTQYHYRVTASNSYGTSNGADATFTTAVCPVPPTATTNAASSVNVTAAILNGTVATQNIAVTAITFDYGPTTAYGASKNATPYTLDATIASKNVTAVVSRLTCNTTYHYRVNAVNAYGSGSGADMTFTTLNSGCIAAPTATSNAASAVTQTSATLNGSVVSSGATATASFDFGPTTAYGTTVASIPAQVYSATAVAVAANQTGLTCATTYHFRAKAVNSAGTGYGLDKTFTTVTCDPTTVNAWLQPPTPTVIVEQPVELNIYANSNSLKLGSYDFLIKYESSKFIIDYAKSVAQCNREIVCPGPDGWSNYAVINAPTSVIDNGITYGTIRIVGSNYVTGAGPGTSLNLLKVYFKAQAIPGTTSMNLTINALLSMQNNPIGMQNSAGSSSIIKISPGKCGDADGNLSVNIVDALAVARKVVGLPPPPIVNTLLADTNKNSRIDINDALMIARYSIGLVLPPEVCAIGQPL